MPEIASTSRRARLRTRIIAGLGVPALYGMVLIAGVTVKLAALWLVGLICVEVLTGHVGISPQLQPLLALAIMGGYLWLSVVALRHCKRALGPLLHWLAGASADAA